jgi:atypical dual specificity phosphatase
LRALAGFNDPNPHFRTWGEAVYGGEPLGDHDRPALVSQSARLMMATILENIVHNLPERTTLTSAQQRDLSVRLLHKAGLDNLADRLDYPVVDLPLAHQRLLAVIRLAAAGPRLLLLDEPTTNLSDDDAEILLEYVRREGERRAVLVVLHNQAQARLVGDHTALLAGGRVQEALPTTQFFEAPQTRAAQQFIKFGSCSVAAPDADPAQLEPDTAPPPPLPGAARFAMSESFGPRGFLWLKRGLLAGTPLPGVFYDVDYDMKALQRVGVTALVNLTENEFDSETLREYDIRGIWSPVLDMGAPSIEQACQLCKQIDELIGASNIVAVHCRAGLGRTGTVLAAYLIWEGASALDALEKVRSVEPRWVQSEEQVRFLEEFAGSIAKADPGPRDAASQLRAVR